MAFEDLLVSLVSKLDDKGFKELDREEARAHKQTDILSGKLKQLFIGTIGTIGAREIIDATVKLDTLKKSMAALAGSDAAGAEQIAYLRKETQRLGQDFEKSASAYQNLFAAGRGSNLSDGDIQKIFTGVLEYSTVLGKSSSETHGALLALEQMISKGKVSMEELQRQLGNALPGSLQIAARAMGVTDSQLRDMVSDGIESKKFVTAFANQLHYEFGEKAAKASHTLRAELARLQNSLFNLETSFLDGDAGEAFAETIRQLVVVLNSSELQSSLKGISQFLTFLLEHIKPIMTIIALLLGNVAVGKIAKVVRGAKGFGKIGLKFAADLLTLTKGVKWLPRIWEIIKLIGWALNPLKKIEAWIWLIVGLLTIIAKVKDHQKKKEKEQLPNWVKTSDGRYTDVNPKSKTFMQFGKEFTQEELHDALRFGNSNDFKMKPHIQRSQFGEYETFGGTKRNIEINGTTINITTKNDNPQGIGEAVKLALLDVFESTRIRNGYPKTAVV